MWNSLVVWFDEYMGLTSLYTSSEKVEQNSDSVGQSKDSVGESNELNDDTEETCSCQEQTLPVFQKIQDLSSKVQVSFSRLFYQNITSLLVYWIIHSDNFFVSSLFLNYSSHQHLRKEHAVLCNEVKGITANSFPGSEVSTALQCLSM